ncbi:multidrug and toxin extrusion protein 1 isoform X5 [Onychostoma macrolepis]|uniref:multidrug and toxin extrusion protein 1 isoform X5 n=1 Tax=Onychostoma macrolepis TaxID=369639 RepID=UPI00272AED77|nr:multidrug and toxin extrusion protein 1 isoform X5 [Onychostoma macrolepis]
MNEPENTSRCQGCLRCFRSFLPVHFTREIVNLCFLALPVFLSYLFDYLIIFVSTVFCGHLGKVELDGVTLATAVISVMGIGIGYGLSAACDTLISQAFGAGNLHLVGVITQKAILILMLACLPCCAFLINTESILLLVGQSPEVARLSQLYVNIFLPGLPAAFVFIIEAKYLQNQGIIWPLVITGVVANVLNALINYIFLFVLDFGVPGSAAANTISQYSLAIILFIYIRCTGLHKDTWPGWSMDCLQEWDSFIHLAIPSMLMMCAEWWTYEIGGLLSGPDQTEEPPLPLSLDEGAVYRVKEILESRRRGGTLEYLVDWEGYGPEECSWVPRDDILDPTLLEEFHSAHPDHPAPRGRGRPPRRPSGADLSRICQALRSTNHNDPHHPSTNHAHLHLYIPVYKPSQQSLTLSDLVTTTWTLLPTIYISSVLAIRVSPKIPSSRRRRYPVE